MAETFVVANAQVQMVSNQSGTDHVPTTQHWLILFARPDDFDASSSAGSVWKYVGEECCEAAVKQFSMRMCVFCLKAFGSDNATKMMKYQS